jgi:murein DD-endopeptidase MepM/ murein hydrolase activator NlpD
MPTQDFNYLYKLILSKSADFHPVFLPDLCLQNTFFMDFSSQNQKLKNLDYNDIDSFNELVFDEIKGSGKTYGYGGYLEDRDLYRRSSVFAISKEQSRSIHLGADIWAPALTPVYCPLDAKVHSFQNNNNHGDYGPTIILEHILENETFYTLYGHLSINSLKNLYENKKIMKGEVFCHLGPYPENGDWPPHLHFQVINDMQSKWGDFWGVCSLAEKEKYSKICLNPILFFPNLTI